MKAAKSYIIWMPKSGSGKSRQVIISPKYLVALSITLAVCILSIPFFQNHIFTLKNKIADLENKKIALENEMSNLKYLKQNLARIENKDRQLSKYFGIDTPEAMEDLFGKGGSSEISEYSDYEKNEENYPANSYLPAHLVSLEGNFEKFEKLLKSKEIIQDSTPNIMPLEQKGTYLSSGFGWRKNPFTKRREFHAAIDIAGNTGTKIIAPANGIVMKTGHDKRLGHFIVLRHSEHIKTIFGHLSRVLVKNGDEVSRGKKIGLMGNSGLSTSSHLHYMVVKDNRAVNPLEYILDMSKNQ